MVKNQPNSSFVKQRLFSLFFFLLLQHIIIIITIQAWQLSSFFCVDRSFHRNRNTGVMTCFGLCLRGRASPPHNQIAEIDEEISTIENARVYSYKELRDATEDFCPVNKIGKGGFGPVYKGRLKDGKMAAIKVLSIESKQGVREFLTEIKVISSIEHENLVKLYGCCAEGDHRILVYNYLENNSLSQTLLGGAHSNLQFSWKTRTKICIGVARGLAFLHEEVQPYIVHRDIKASNILLDRDLTPKISDFGLAKLIPADMTHVSTRVAGTLGYLAPEYAIRGQLTRKADIYSFGILLLEIVSGRCNTNKRLPIEEQYLLERAWRLYKKGELIQLVDALLGDDFDVDEACRFLKVCLLCTQVLPKSRPSMSTAVKLLTGEMEVDDEEISEPGMLSDLQSLRNQKHTSSGSLSGGSGKQVDSSPSMDTTMTHGTMTFTTIDDRDS